MMFADALSRPRGAPRQMTTSLRPSRPARWIVSSSIGDQGFAARADSLARHSVRARTSAPSAAASILQYSAALRRPARSDLVGPDALLDPARFSIGVGGGDVHAPGRHCRCRLHRQREGCPSAVSWSGANSGPVREPPRHQIVARRGRNGAGCQVSSGSCGFRFKRIEAGVHGWPRTR